MRIRASLTARSVRPIAIGLGGAFARPVDAFAGSGAARHLIPIPMCVSRILVFLALVFVVGPVAATAEEAPGVFAPAAVAEQTIDELARDEFAAVVNRFDAAMRRTLPEPRLRKVWESLKQQVGPFRRRLATRVESLPTGQVVFVTCDFRDMELDARLLFNASGELASLTFGPKQAAP